MGRKKKPVELLEGHRSHKYRDFREKSEQKTRIGKPALGRCPNEISSDAAALKKWGELSELYDGFQFVTSADRDIVTQYCVAWSVYVSYVDARRDIIDEIKSKNGGGASKTIAAAMIKTELDDKIAKQTQLLQKLADKIFLNPTSRIQAIPEPKEKQKQSPIERAGFGGI